MIDKLVVFIPTDREYGILDGFTYYFVVLFKSWSSYRIKMFCDLTNNAVVLSKSNLVLRLYHQYIFIDNYLTFFHSKKKIR